MSDVKVPKKSDAGPKKVEATKPVADQSATAAETPSADKSASKTETAPKSASQSSISHFSSVSTPAYRSGWEQIFGGGEASKKAKSKAKSRDEFPGRLTISDEDIEKELRNILYKAFQRQAKKQGYSLSKVKQKANIEYSLECNVIEK